MAGQFALKAEIPGGVLQFLVFAYKDPVGKHDLSVVEPDVDVVHLQGVAAVQAELQVQFVERDPLPSEGNIVGILFSVLKIGALIVQQARFFPGTSVVCVKIDVVIGAAVLTNIIVRLDLDIQLDLVHRPLIDIPGPHHQFFVEIQIDRFPAVHLAVSDKTYRIHKLYPGVVGRYLNAGEIPCGGCRSGALLFDKYLNLVKTHGLSELHEVGVRFPGFEIVVV